MSQNNPYDEVSQQVAHEMMPLKGDENPEVGFKSNSYDQYDTRNLDKVYYSRLKHIVRDPKSGELKGLLQSKESSVDVVDHDDEKVRSYDEIDACGIFDYKDLLEYLYSDRNVLENQLGISWNKVKEIVRRTPKDDNGNIDYKDFLETVKRYRLNTEQGTALKSIVRSFAYAEEFTCVPFKWFMPLVTLIETIIFTYHCIHLSTEHGLTISWDGPVPYCSVLIYDPYKRYQVWRYITYMFVHIGVLHYIFNMIMQLLVGVFLEMEQEDWKGSFRVMAVYFSGVLAGSLGTSIVNPNTYVAGASGGIYALIAAHLSTMILNWKEDNAIKIRKVIHKPMTKIIRIIFISFLTIHDFAIAIYETYVLKKDSQTGYIGHLCGAIAGILVGFFILKNRRVLPWESTVQWICFTIFAICVTFGIIWNATANYFVDDYFRAPKYDQDSEKCFQYLYI